MTEFQRLSMEFLSPHPITVYIIGRKNNKKKMNNKGVKK